MKTFFLAVFLLLLVALGQAGNGFVITGSVTGLAEGTVVKLVNGNDNSDMASAKVAGGIFTVKGSVEEPQLCKLAIGSETPQYIYVENKKITVAGTKADLQHLKISGPPSHQDFISFQKV